MNELYRLTKIAEYVTFNNETGEFPDKTGKDRKRKKTNGYWYIRIRVDNKTLEVLAHHFIHYLAFGYRKGNIPLLRNKDEMSISNSSFGAGEKYLNPNQFKHYLELADLKEKQPLTVIRKTKPILREKTFKLCFLNNDFEEITKLLKDNNILHATSKRLLACKLQSIVKLETKEKSYPITEQDLFPFPCQVV